MAPKTTPIPAVFPTIVRSRAPWSLSARSRSIGIPPGPSEVPDDHRSAVLDVRYRLGEGDENLVAASPTPELGERQIWTSCSFSLTLR